MVERVSTAALPLTGADNAKPAPHNVREAAGQFEALLLSQMLKSARAGSGWLDEGEDQAGATATEMAEEQLAQAMARQGGLGLARMVAEHLRTGPSGR
jgi:Rod binding domain-containing protein